MENKVTQVKFAINRITTEQFAIIENAFVQGKDIRINTNIRYASDNVKKMIACFSTFTYECEKKPFMLIECGCHFFIFKDSWDEMYNKENNTLIVPKSFLIHLAVLSVGTSRGILHSKTEGTDFNKFILPTINVAEMIKGDAEFKFEEN